MKTFSAFLLLIAMIGCAATTHRGEAIRNRLSESEGLAAHNISIDEDSAGIITLNGNVSSDRDRDTIERVARETKGVREVRSNLVVNPSSVAVREDHSSAYYGGRTVERSISRDDQISQNVRESLHRGTNLDLRNVDIMTRDGIVTLRGSQNSNRDIDDLVANARRVSGVREVRNELTLANRGYYNDRYYQR